MIMMSVKPSTKIVKLWPLCQGIVVIASVTGMYCPLLQVLSTVTGIVLFYKYCPLIAHFSIVLYLGFSVLLQCLPKVCYRYCPLIAHFTMVLVPGVQCVIVVITSVTGIVH